MSDTVLLTLPALTLDGIGWTATGAITGTAQLTFPALALSTAESINGAAQLTLPALTLAALGVTGRVGVAALQLPPLTLSAAGTTGNIGALNATLGAIALAAQGHTGILGTASLMLPVLQLSASGGYVTAVASLTIPALRLVAVGTTAAAGTSQGWVLQTEKMALCEYDAVPFNSLAQFNGVYLGATADGIFALSGDLDGSSEIAALIRTGSTDFATSHLKRIERVWVQYRTTGALTLTVVTDGGVRTSYPLPPTGSTGMHGHDVAIGQGLVSKYWAFEAANVGGCDFALDAIEPKPLVLKRRHGGGNA